MGKWGAFVISCTPTPQSILGLVLYVWSGRVLSLGISLWRVGRLRYGTGGSLSSVTSVARATLRRYAPCGISVSYVGRRSILPAIVLVVTVRVGVRPMLSQGASGAPVDGQEGGSVDLRDNQLNELSSRDAPGSVSAASAGPDSLEGATVVLQASTDASQNVLAGLALNSNSPDAPNSDSVNLNSNCSDAPNSDCVNLSNCADLPSNVSNDSLNNEMEVIDGNSNSGNASDISEREIVNGNCNDDGTVNSNDNGNSESPISSNSNDNNGLVISHDNGNSESNGEMITTETSDSSNSDSEDGEIRSDASIGGAPSGDESSLDSIHSTDRDGFVLPLPAKQTARKPPVVVSPGRSRSVSPLNTGRSRSPLVAGKHPLPPAVPSRPKSRRS